MRQQFTIYPAGLRGWMKLRLFLADLQGKGRISGFRQPFWWPLKGRTRVSVEFQSNEDATICKNSVGRRHRTLILAKALGILRGHEGRPAASRRISATGQTVDPGGPVAR